MHVGGSPGISFVCGQQYLWSRRFSSGNAYFVGCGYPQRRWVPRRIRSTAFGLRLLAKSRGTQREREKRKAPVIAVGVTGEVSRWLLFWEYPLPLREARAFSWARCTLLH